MHPAANGEKLKQCPTRYQQIMGMLRSIGFGRIYIQIDVVIMTQYMTALRLGHLESYLRNYTLPGQVSR